jgi:glutamate 5-kinase
MMDDYIPHDASEIPWDLVNKAEIIVIKFGTRSLVKDNKDFDEDLFAKLGQDIQQLIELKKKIVIVSSGAVNAGIKHLQLTERPKELLYQQMLAAVGNPLLIGQYRKHIKSPIAQVLVTQEDLSNRTAFVNIRNTLNLMLKEGIIPVINENDVVSINELYAEEEIEYNFSDNDLLSALMASTVNADLLIIFSDIEGLYTKHPNSKFKKFVPYVPIINDKIRSMAKSGSNMGRGGMISKIMAAEIATQSGINVFLTHAKKNRLIDVINGIATGTFFMKMENKIKNKQFWLIHAGIVRGNIIIDEGAKNAILEGNSLLFPGIIEFKGHFNKDDIVSIEYEGKTIARGVINFSYDALERFSKISKDERKEYFKKNHIREIITSEKIGISNWN